MKNKIKKLKAKPLKRSRQKKYSTHYLAIVLAMVLIFEGAMFNISSAPDWQKAATVLDMSAGIAQTSRDLGATFQPMIDAVQSVNQFYQLAATQMMELLNLSDSGFGSEATFVYVGVADFYRQASSQMAELLDESSVASWPAIVAGASIGN